MPDIFLTQDLNKLLKGKKVALLGDSNVRALYKDLLCLHEDSKLIAGSVLKSKMEKSCHGDTLIEHGHKTNGRDYKEHRQYERRDFSLSFYFLTRVYSDYMEKILRRFQRKDSCPDVLVINSCLWDISRWGPRGVEDYKRNLKVLCKKLKEILDPTCLVIWLTTPPLAQEMRGGFLLVELEFLKYSMRFHVVEANHYARQVVVKSGYDVLDVHYHLRMQLQQRAPDGIHWMPLAVRHMTNLLLTHISLAWGVSLPGRYESSMVVSERDTTDNELAYEEPEIDQNAKRVKKEMVKYESQTLKSKVHVASDKSEKVALKDISNSMASTSGLKKSEACGTPFHAPKKNTANKTFCRYWREKRRQKAMQKIRKFEHDNPLLPSPVVVPFDYPLGSPIRATYPSAMHEHSFLPYSHAVPPYLPTQYPHILPQYPPILHPSPHYDRYPRNAQQGYSFNFQSGHPMAPRFNWADTGRPFRFGGYN